MSHIGEFAALAVAFSWSFTAIFFSEAGRLLGSYRVNKIRLVMVIVIYMIALSIMTGSPLPTDINATQFALLSISGLIGLVIGDSAGFKALVMLGPRLTALVYCTIPVATTIVAWLFLGEHLGLVQLLGITITLSGVAWVVMEREYQTNKRQLHEDHPDHGTKTKGVLLACVGSICQSVGFVMSKQAMMYSGPQVNPLKAALVRMIAAAIIIWAWAIIRGEAKGALTAVRNGKGMLFTFGGTFFGPFLSVWGGLFAITHISAGVAATISSISPILILPTVMLIYKEHVSFRALFGVIIALCGVALLFLGDEIFGLH